MDNSLLKLHQESLLDSWLDAYGHLNEAYYLVPMSNATWKLQDYFDIGTHYFEQTGCALYTVETHLRYLAEIRAPALLSVASQVIDVDSKRIWLTHSLMVDDRLCATGEFMLLHYDTRAARVAPLPESAYTKLQAAKPAQRPDWASAHIGWKSKAN